MNVNVYEHEPRVEIDNTVYTVEIRQTFGDDLQYTFEEYEDGIAYLTDTGDNVDVTKQEYVESAVENLIRETNISDVRTVLGEQMGSLNITVPANAERHIPFDSGEV